MLRCHFPFFLLSSGFVVVVVVVGSSLEFAEEGDEEGLEERAREFEFAIPLAGLVQRSSPHPEFFFLISRISGVRSRA